jgi:hypothetical protein
MNGPNTKRTLSPIPAYRGGGSCLIFSFSTSPGCFKAGRARRTVSCLYRPVFSITSTSGLEVAILGIWHGPICHAMDTDDDLFISNPVNEARLLCRYGEPAVYAPVLRAMIPVGHFVIVRAGQERSIVCQIIGRVNGNDKLVEVLPFIPLYSAEANEYFSNVTMLLPRSLTESACTGVIEVFRTSSIAEVSASSISNVAFIFLVEHLRNHLVYIHGMFNAFALRFKYSLETRSLLALDSDSFKCFPDLDPQYQQRWSDCYGRTIFSAIDHLRQEIWRFLCRYGQSQGMFPHQTLNLYFPTVFTNYVANYLQVCGVPYDECCSREAQRRVEVNFMYRMVSTECTYRYFRLDSAEHMEYLTKLLGTMAVFGIRKRMPKKDTVVEIHNFDLLNVIQCIEFFIHASKVKMRVYAFRHQVGDEVSCPWLLPHLSAPTAVAEPLQHEIRLKSKFDHLGSVYEVVEELPNGVIKTMCKWGPLRGTEKVFSKDDVVRLVNLKHGNMN